MGTHKTDSVNVSESVVVDIRPGVRNGSWFDPDALDWRDQDGVYQEHSDKGLLNTHKSEEKNGRKEKA